MLLLLPLLLLLLVPLLLMLLLLSLLLLLLILVPQTLLAQVNRTCVMPRECRCECASKRIIFDGQGGYQLVPTVWHAEPWMHLCACCSSLAEEIRPSWWASSPSDVDGAVA